MVWGGGCWQRDQRLVRPTREQTLGRLHFLEILALARPLMARCDLKGRLSSRLRRSTCSRTVHDVASERVSSYNKSSLPPFSSDLNGEGCGHPSRCTPSRHKETVCRLEESKRSEGAMKCISPPGRRSRRGKSSTVSQGCETYRLSSTSRKDLQSRPCCGLRGRGQWTG